MHGTISHHPDDDDEKKLTTVIGKAGCGCGNINKMTTVTGKAGCGCGNRKCHAHQHSEGPPVDSAIVRLLKQDFWSEVVRSAAERVGCSAGPHVLSAHSKVGHLRG